MWDYGLVHQVSALSTTAKAFWEFARFEFDGLNLTPRLTRLHLTPKNGYKFPELTLHREIHRPRPAGIDAVVWLLETVKKHEIANASRGSLGN